MNRIAWIAVLLLVATNVAWGIAWLSERTTVAPSGLDTEVAAQDEVIAGLRAEIAGLRSPAPALAGRGSETAGDPVAEEVIQSTPQSEDAAATSAADDEAAALKQAQKEGLARLTATVRRIMQVEDPALRAEGLRELEHLISSSDPFDVELGLSGVYHVRKAEIDLSGFRALALEQLDSEHAGTRRSALYALHAADPDAAELRFALASATDEDRLVRGHAARLLRLYGAGMDGEAAAAIVDLLDDSDAGVRKGTMRSFWGAHPAPEVQAKLIEVAARPDERYDAIYFGLSPMSGKSRAVVDTLFAALDDDNAKIRARAHWGLQRGIPDDEKAHVARGYTDHLARFLTPQAQREALTVIARFGDAGLAPDLERFADNEMVDAEIRALAAKAAAYLVDKPR